jgi:hypothetical protein
MPEDDHQEEIMIRLDQLSAVIYLAQAAFIMSFLVLLFEVPYFRTIVRGLFELFGPKFQ